MRNEDRRALFCVVRALPAGVMGTVIGAPAYVFGMAAAAGSEAPSKDLFELATVIGFFSLWVTIPAAVIIGMVAGMSVGHRIAARPARSLGIIVAAAVLVPVGLIGLVGLSSHDAGEAMLGAMLLTVPFSLSASVVFCWLLWRGRDRLARLA